ncbi:cysteinyl-tRNA synthetase [Halodesulfurarchaeum formicicum]|uniref:Cysteine--tRNA ligase n=1 Tax=Halodesulfurarchaeum formicicum TaxID=1873524 RepID=A0A1D8S530_9EURY|nr:cysteine--tRNA ligase [Halodesulfurarchaeum formicicum]AOW80457.1 cysteinyl-tRNA synthetase [Halodesulfurarchaeum formicicum]
MPLSVTNTLTGEREPFEPQDPDSVLLYYCGLTVSDDAHLGHARSWVQVDVMHRWLEHLGYSVRHVENFTDVNEKIVARVGSEELGGDEQSVAMHYISSVIEDMRGLNLKRASVYPRVSEHVPEIIDLIEALIERDHAYVSNGSVYFDVSSFPEYGKLSGQNLEAMESQGPEAERAEKEAPQDFALWKAGPVDPETVAEHRDGDPAAVEAEGQTWDAPWGEGRPGWHIECSAMSMAHLDESIDIHVGGQDLVFPHHENEIAQSEAATGKQFAKYWLHVNLLETEGEKMSTSLENFFTVKTALDELGTNAVRMFLLSAQYRQSQTYSEGTIEEAIERWDRLERAYDRAVAAADSPDAYATEVDETLLKTVSDQQTAFREAMNDDFNTRGALAALFEIVGAVNEHVTDRDRYDYEGLHEAIEAFETLGGEVLGFVFAGTSPDGEVELAAELIEELLSVRESRREAGDYESADRIRDRLSELGVEVQDTDQGPEFRL